uniref:Uncharacterized protein n=1 Tax=Aegilops tauschii subsp. strangulata TaxID=200361 RepID=A0A452Y1D3_AEGTS
FSLVVFYWLGQFFKGYPYHHDSFSLHSGTEPCTHQPVISSFLLLAKLICFSDLKSNNGVSGPSLITKIELNVY